MLHRRPRACKDEAASARAAAPSAAARVVHVNRLLDPTQSTTELAMNGLVMILVAVALMLLPIFARTPASDLRDDANGG
jgi:hypothetical protein